MRELLWRWKGRQSYDLWQTLEVVAAIYNAQRSKRSDKVWTVEDLHPLATKHEKPRRSDPDVVNRITREMQATHGVYWMEGSKQNGKFSSS